MPFKNENISSGLPKNSDFQSGVSDVDSGSPGALESAFLLPFPADPAFMWVYYDCAIGTMLDSGIVVHRRLPQVNNVPDTLSSCLYSDPKLESIAGPGVSLKCNDQYADVVQRMGHSQYWFRLWGQALRIGFQVPIPGIKFIGGVPAIPYDKNPQWAFNRIFPGGNYNGFILWHAVWSLWYTVAVPPGSNDIPAANPYAHIDNTMKTPSKVQSPYTQPDDNAVRAPGGAFGAVNQAPNKLILK